ncbi:YoaK family protein [Nonomuraea sp. NPDC001831]|uniref:YoaK family protein n=1 Tax=Nonomuraea sp. NPDC001831 TaxID=3364340 RepID=UPI0036784761
MRFGRFSMLALALAAGAVDALSFLALGQVFTANMTGNIVLLGLALGTGDTSHVIRSGLALTTFCLGLTIGFALLNDPAGRAPPPAGEPDRVPARPPAGVPDRVPVRPLAVLLAELALLVVVAAGWTARALPHAALIAASGTAMGLQSAVTRWAGGPGLSTTYVTGTLTSLAGRAVGPRSGVLRPLAVVLCVVSGAVVAASALRVHAAVTPFIAPATVAAATAAWALTATHRAGPRPRGRSAP